MKFILRKTAVLNVEIRSDIKNNYFKFEKCKIFGKNRLYEQAKVINNNIKHQHILPKSSDILI